MSDGGFRGGRNIAVKVPPHDYDATVRFYRDVIGLPVIADMAPDTVFEFGACRLWIDSVEAMSQAEIWLEIRTENYEQAAAHLADHGVARRDEIERLPEGFEGFWISSPSSIIHLVTEDSAL